MDNRKNGQHTLLAVFAHPDDETFGTGGTLAHYAAQGANVVVVSATRGEAGEIADPGLATPENLAAVRESELQCAAHTLGASEVIFLDYRDSGMAGTAENDHPQAFINAPPDEVVERLVQIIRRVQPDVVVTFEPGGGYGHPDHMAIHRHTVAAFHAAADPGRFTEAGPAFQPARLFFTALPRSFFREITTRMTARGLDTSEFAGFEERGWADEDVHVVLDVRDAIAAKWEAFFCHQTQLGPDSFFRRLPEDLLKEGLSQEHFALAWPSPEPGFKMEGLFVGL